MARTSNVFAHVEPDLKEQADREVLEQLKNVSIEEFNREKRGFKTKLLREYGYCTLADISGASVYSIASIRGISEDYNEPNQRFSLPQSQAGNH